MRQAFFSKDRQARVGYVEQFLRLAAKPMAVYIAPQNRKPLAPQSDCSISYVSYEEMLKTDKWLAIHELIGENTALILDNPSRYAKLTSTKALSVKRLGVAGAKAIVDVAPFVFGTHHLFHPMSFLGKDILGYASYSAWRENYHEVDEGGVVRLSHDPVIIAQKLKSVCQIDYAHFACPNRTIVRFSSTPQELMQYAELRAEIFSEDKFAPQPAITRLADLVHAFDSRIDAYLGLLSELKGATIVYTNLRSYAQKAKAAANKLGLNVEATSYQIGTDKVFDNVIYLESPIVNRHYFLEAESKTSENSQVFHFLGDTKVDIYLYEEVNARLSEINNFTQELYGAIAGTGCRASEIVFASECAASSPRADQLDLFQLQNC